MPLTADGIAIAFFTFFPGSIAIAVWHASSGMRPPASKGGTTAGWWFWSAVAGVLAAFLWPRLRWVVDHVETGLSVGELGLVAAVILAPACAALLLGQAARLPAIRNVLVDRVLEARASTPWDLVSESSDYTYVYFSDDGGRFVGAVEEYDTEGNQVLLRHLQRVADDGCRTDVPHVTGAILFPKSGRSFWFEQSKADPSA